MPGIASRLIANKRVSGATMGFVYLKDVEQGKI